MKSKCRIPKNSYSLVEVLIAMGMLVLLSLAVTSISIASIRASILAKHRLQAVFIAQEQLEIMHNVRDSNLLFSPYAFTSMSYGVSGGCTSASNGYCGGVDPHCCDINENSPTKHTRVYFRPITGTWPANRENRYYTDIQRDRYGDTNLDLTIGEPKGDQTIKITYNTKIQITTLSDTTIEFYKDRDGTLSDIILSYLRPGHKTAISTTADPIELAKQYSNIRENAPRRVRIVVEWKEQTVGKQQLFLEQVLTNLLVVAPPP